MEVSGITRQTIVVDDAYTGIENYVRVDDNDVVHFISKEEPGPNPRRVKSKPDAGIAKITNGTGIIK